MGHIIHNGRVDEAQLGGGDLYAVGEGVAGESVVEESGLRTDGPEPKPDENKGIRVLEVHGDNVPRRDAQDLPHPGAIAEDAVVDGRVGVPLPFKKQEFFVAVGPRLSKALEEVEEVESVDALTEEEAGESGEGVVEEADVVPQGAFGVEVGNGCSDGRGGDGDGN